MSRECESFCHNIVTPGEWEWTLHLNIKFDCQCQIGMIYKLSLIFQNYFSIS